MVQVTRCVYIFFNLFIYFYVLFGIEAMQLLSDIHCHMLVVNTIRYSFNSVVFCYFLVKR